MDHPTQPDSLTMEKWKERKDLMEYVNDRTWPYHSVSAYAMKIRTSVLNRFWSKHITDQNGLRGDRPPCVKYHGRWPFAAVPKATFSFAMAVMETGERMEGRKVGGVVLRCVHVDPNQGCIM